MQTKIKMVSIVINVNYNKINYLLLSCSQQFCLTEVLL